MGTKAMAVSLGIRGFEPGMRHGKMWARGLQTEPVLHVMLCGVRVKQEEEGMYVRVCVCGRRNTWWSVLLGALLHGFWQVIPPMSSLPTSAWGPAFQETGLHLIASLLRTHYTAAHGSKIKGSAELKYHVFLNSSHFGNSEICMDRQAHCFCATGQETSVM
jgi:hypothetical protein